MRILWVSASPIGPAARILNMPYGGSSGVWIQTIYEELARGGENEMFFLCYSRAVGRKQALKSKTEEGTAYCLPMPRISFGRRAPAHLKKSVARAVAEIRPDIIHIWGTETCVQNVVAEVAPDVPKVVFLQGLINVHKRYYNAPTRRLSLPLGRTPREWVTERVRTAMFCRQARFEKEELCAAGNVILDSAFATAIVKSIAPHAKLFEYRLLPPHAFFEEEHRHENATPHTVFTVYGGSRDKGLHQLLRALAIVKRTVPDVKLYIPGPFHTNGQGGLDTAARLSANERLLFRIIHREQLADNVVFCGKLSQAEMAAKMASCSLFVNPSVMENHAGALREALALGMPAISTYCGSVGEYVTEGVTGMLYRYEEHEVLAHKMLTLLTTPNLAERMGQNAHAAMQKAKAESAADITEIYQTILKKD